jgi:hypothetical protein
VDTGAVLFPGVKWPWREADNSSASSAEVKNSVAVPLRFHTPSWRCSKLAEQRDNFTSSGDKHKVIRWREENWEAFLTYFPYFEKVKVVYTITKEG